MDYIRRIFYNSKILKPSYKTDEEMLRQWVLRTDYIKETNQDFDSLNKAKAVILKLLNREIINEGDYMVLHKMWKKYRQDFKSNRKELENPIWSDVLTMDSLTLDELNETIQDKKNICFRQYYHAFWEIARASEDGVVVRPTSGGLYKSNTPTTDFVENQPQDYNPMDDIID